MFGIMMLIGKKMGISFITNIVQFGVGVLIYLVLILVSKDKTAFKLINMLKSLKKGG